MTIFKGIENAIGDAVKKISKRKIAVIKKYLFIVSALLSLSVFPLQVSAEIIQDQPVQLIHFKDFSFPDAVTESHARSGHEEDSFEFFAGPVFETYDLSIDSSYRVEAPLKQTKPKMKVMTCHVTSNTSNTMKTIFPWVSSGTKVAHIAYFEVLNKSDAVKFKVTIHGPEFTEPLVVKTLTFGPQEPLYQWGIGFWRTYSVPGLYKLRMTAIPETNRISGRSSIECSFRVLATQASE